MFTHVIQKLYMHAPRHTRKHTREQTNIHTHHHSLPLVRTHFANASKQTCTLVYSLFLMAQESQHTNTQSTQCTTISHNLSLFHAFSLALSLSRSLSLSHTHKHKPTNIQANILDGSVQEISFEIDNSHTHICASSSFALFFLI